MFERRDRLSYGVLFERHSTIRIHQTSFHDSIWDPFGLQTDQVNSLQVVHTVENPSYAYWMQYVHYFNLDPLMQD